MQEGTFKDQVTVELSAGHKPEQSGSQVPQVEVPASNGIVDVPGIVALAKTVSPVISDLGLRSFGHDLENVQKHIWAIVRSESVMQATPKAVEFLRRGNKKANDYADVFEALLSGSELKLSPVDALAKAETLPSVDEEKATQKSEAAIQPPVPVAVEPIVVQAEVPDQAPVVAAGSEDSAHKLAEMPVDGTSSSVPPLAQPDQTIRADSVTPKPGKAGKRRKQSVTKPECRQDPAVDTRAAPMPAAIGIPGAAVQETRTIEIAKIQSDDLVHPRDSINNDTVAEYADAMKTGVEFPPITVFYDGKKYYLGDGAHRAAACQKLGRRDVKAEIRQGTERDAILFSVAANADHGLRRTSADKRKAVLILLADKEWQQWSHNKIAQQCNVSDGLVTAVWRDVQDELHLPKLEDSPKRIVERNGKTYAQNTGKIGIKNADEECQPEDRATEASGDPLPPVVPAGDTMLTTSENETDPSDLRPKALQHLQRLQQGADMLRDAEQLLKPDDSDLADLVTTLRNATLKRIEQLKSEARDTAKTQKMAKGEAKHAA